MVDLWTDREELDVTHGLFRLFGRMGTDGNKYRPCIVWLSRKSLWVDDRMGVKMMAIQI